MKKLVPVVLLALVVAMVALFFLRVGAPHQPRAAELAPAETILFVQVPDLVRTGERWKQTELYRLWQEPEVQAFLEKPRAARAFGMHFDERLARFQQIATREIFLAVTSIDGPVPQFVAGFSFRGSVDHAEALLAEPWAQLKKAWPAGRADLVSYGGAEIETFSDQGTTVARTFRERWFFVANDLELLQRTLDRHDGKNRAESLATASAFQRATARLPAENDALLVAQTRTIAERLSALLAASGQQVDAQQLAELERTEAIAAATRIEGTQFRDTIFVLRPGSPGEEPLPRRTLALTSPATLLYLALTLPKRFELPSSTLALTSLLLPAFEPVQRSLEEQGLEMADFGKAFGTELGTMVEWPQESLQPSLLLALDVRDKATATALVQAVTAEPTPEMSWARLDRDGATVFTATGPGLVTLSPSFALSDEFLVFGLSQDPVFSALKRLRSGEVRLDGTQSFSSAAKTVATPTSAYGYLDLRALFERSYGTFRPFLIMSLAFMPEAGKYIDAGKLPATETISRHLGPMVLSQSTTDEGTLLESTGTVTFNQALIGVIGGSISAALPQLKALPAGALDPARLFQPPPSEEKPEPAKEAGQPDATAPGE